MFCTEGTTKLNHGGAVGEYQANESVDASVFETGHLRRVHGDHSSYHRVFQRARHAVRRQKTERYVRGDAKQRALQEPAGRGDVENENHGVRDIYDARGVDAVAEPSFRPSIKEDVILLIILCFRSNDSSNILSIC